MKIAHFPHAREIDGFDFDAQPSVDPHQIRELGFRLLPMRMRGRVNRVVDCLLLEAIVGLLGRTGGRFSADEALPRGAAASRATAIIAFIGR